MPNMDSIHVATFNVNLLCVGPSNDKVASTIANCGAEVVCLQESNESWESFLCSRSDIKHIYPTIRFHNHGNPWGGFAVLSKHPIEAFKVIPETHPCWYPAGLVTLSIPQVSSSESVNARRSLQLLIVHLRAPVEFSPKPYWWGGRANWVGGFFSESVKKERLHEMQTFASALRADLPTVILGDFNERRNASNCLEYLKKLGFENTPKGNSEGSCFPCGCSRTTTWSFQIGGIPLLCFDYDHIVYSKKCLDLVDFVAYIHKAGGSDHRLVSAQFRFKES